MLNAQAAKEIQDMTADLANAKTRADLGQLYFNWIGYDCFEDDPEMTDENAREILTDYIKEFRFACASGQA